MKLTGAIAGLVAGALERLATCFTAATTRCHHSALVRRNGRVLCLDWRNAGPEASTPVNRHALVAVALHVARMLTVRGN